MGAATYVSISDASVTVGVAPTTARAADWGRNYLFIQNTHATNNAAVSFSGAAVLNAAGSINLAPNDKLEFTTAVPGNAVSVVGSGAGTTITVYFMV